MSNTVPPRDPESNLVPKTAFIYVLIDPETNEIRYVGKANDPQERHKQHLAHSLNQMRGTHTGYWIASLRKRGLKPLLETIEEVPFAIWEERELYWIEWHLQHGHPLTNTYFGGKGVGMVPPEVRAKMSASHKGKKRSPESVAKGAAARRGKPMSEEQKAKLSAARKGKPGHPSTPETNAKIAAAKKGKKREPFSEEHRRKLGDVNRGKKQSPEHVAKRSTARKGMKHSPEAIEKMSDARKRWYAMKKSPPSDSPTLWDE